MTHHRSGVSERTSSIASTEASHARTCMTIRAFRIRCPYPIHAYQVIFIADPHLLSAANGRHIKVIKQTKLEHAQES